MSERALDQPVDKHQREKDHGHESRDPAPGVERVLQDFLRVLVPRRAENERDRDDQRYVVQQVGR